MLNKKKSSNHAAPLLPVPTYLKPAGKIETEIRCLMFDIYGTLFISGVGDISIARRKQTRIAELDKLLDKFGLKQKSAELHKNLFREIEKRHAELKRLGIDYPEVEIDRIWMKILGNDNRTEARRFAEAFELTINPVYPMPHLKELLAACKDSEIVMGIISNAQFYTADLFKKFLGYDIQDMGFHSDLIIYSYKFGRAKPSELLFRIAAARLKDMGISSESVLYIGNDMLNDILPAKKTGFKTALFAGDKRSLRLRKDEPGCKNIKADIIVTDLSQLLKYVATSRLPKDPFRKK